MWIDAASWCSGSTGAYCVHLSTSPAYWGPPTSTTLLAPAARTALSISCEPAAVKETPGQLPPSRTQVHAAVESWFESGCGSLYRSNSTAGASFKGGATEAQYASEWSRSAIGCCPVASCVPGAE